MKKAAAVFAALSLTILSGCASQQTSHLSTESGWPEAVIEADRESVKDAIIEKHISAGALLSEETSRKLTFTAEDNSLSANRMLTQLALGNSYSTNPLYRLDYMFSGGDNETKVIAQSSVSTQMAFGQTKNMSLKGSKKEMEAIQGLLDAIKEELEKKHATPYPNHGSYRYNSRY